MDLARLILLAGGFGLLVCAHLALLLALALHPPRRRALFALFVPPLAPYFGFLQGRRAWSATWLLALIAYGLGVLVAGR
jgi:hypothetical protein